MPQRKNNSSLTDLLRLKEADSNEMTSDIIQGVLDGLRELMVMDAAFIAEFSGGERVFRFVSCDVNNAPIKVDQSDPLEDSFCHHIVEGRLPELIHDAADIPLTAAMPVTKQLGIGAYLGVPICFSDGATFGTLCCFTNQADDSLNERNLEVLRVAAMLTAKVLERQAKCEARQEELTARITRAIEVGQITILYQPIYSMAEREMQGVEALVRFADAADRSPIEWFGEAAEVGLTVELEMAIIRRALQGLPYLPSNLYVSVNVSLETLMSDAFAAFMKDAPDNRIVIELTEHEAVFDYAQVNERLQKLRKNTRLAVDDVGAGYSSMRHILDLGPEIIKLDISMVRNIHQRPSRSAFVEAMVKFAETSGSNIVAEGVESKEELDELAKLGVSHAQGFYLCQPMPLLKIDGNLSESDARRMVRELSKQLNQSESPPEDGHPRKLGSSRG